MIMQIVKFRSNMALEEVRKVAQERASEFRAVPGLLQKYYVSTEESGQYAGVYVWDNVGSLQRYRESELASTIPQAYQVLGPPEIELYEIAFTLRD